MDLALVNFNTGEISPKIDARSDTEKYAGGCRLLDNMIPTVYGAAERRPGAKWISDAKVAGHKSRLIPFVYSSTVAYMAEFADADLSGNKYCRVFDTTGALIWTSSANAHPYATDDFDALQYKQLGDVLWLIHPKYKPRKLTRTSVSTFSIAEIPFERGPFLTRNDLSANPLYSSGTTLATMKITRTGTSPNYTWYLTCDKAFFDSTHVGAFFSLTFPKYTTRIEVTPASTADGSYKTSATMQNVRGTFTFATQGVWSGVVQVLRNVNGTGEEIFREYGNVSGGNRNISFSTTESESNVTYRVRTTSSEASGWKMELVSEVPSYTTIVKVITKNSTTECTVGVYEYIDVTNDLNKTTMKWAEGAWSDYRGYPAAFTFFEGRAVYAGGYEAATAPLALSRSTVWLSATGDYEEFMTDVKDADPFTLTIESTNPIRWVESAESLLVGTAGDEWRIASSKLDQPVTPTNFTIRQQSFYGSTALQPLKINNTTLFVDFVGRKVRELVFDADQQKYLAPDMTALAEHITTSGIVSFARQKNPESIIWCTLADGTLVSMCYQRDQNVVAWARHTVGGSAFIESVAVTPTTTEDQIWLMVKRTINGSTYRSIEILAPRALPASVNDATFVDSYVTYSGTAANTSPASHLKVCSVVCLASGVVQTIGGVPTALGDAIAYTGTTNSSGVFTLPTNITATKMIIGLPYTWKLIPNRLDVTRAGTSTQGTIARIGEIAINFLKTLGVSFGSPESSAYDETTYELYDIDFAKEQLATKAALHTGTVRVASNSGFDYEDSIILTNAGPYPCTIRSMIPVKDETGR